jgi:hypothetical protein
MRHRVLLGRIPPTAFFWVCAMLGVCTLAGCQGAGQAARPLPPEERMPRAELDAMLERVNAAGNAEKACEGSTNSSIAAAMGRELQHLRPLADSRVERWVLLMAFESGFGGPAAKDPICAARQFALRVCIDAAKDYYILLAAGRTHEAQVYAERIMALVEPVPAKYFFTISALQARAVDRQHLAWAKAAEKLEFPKGRPLPLTPWVRRALAGEDGEALSGAYVSENNAHLQAIAPAAKASNEQQGNALDTSLSVTVPR